MTVFANSQAEVRQIKSQVNKSRAMYVAGGWSPVMDSDLIVTTEGQHFWGYRKYTCSCVSFITYKSQEKS